MSKYEEVDEILKSVDAFVDGGQPETIVTSAEAKLGLVFPTTFRKYLLKWDNVSFGALEYYGLTSNADFDNASVPNSIWFTLRKRGDVGLPSDLVVFRISNDKEYMCIRGTSSQEEGEQVVIWDNVEREISQVIDTSFIDYLRAGATAGLPSSALRWAWV
ncbi:MAG: SMI1/KNR4 family protein [Pirellulales bacterium]|nr:SMI1/KNR4 family protein [Pirellulales bacterium]